MPGYTIIKIEGNTAHMEKADGHGGVSTITLSVNEFEKRFNKKAAVGVVA